MGNGELRNWSWGLEILDCERWELETDDDLSLLCSSCVLRFGIFYSMLAQRLNLRSIYADMKRCR